MSPVGKDAMRARANRGGPKPGLTEYTEQVAAWEAGALDAPGVEPDLIALNLIAPDPIQPRRAMPEMLRADWVAGHPIEAVFSSWEQAATDELAEAGYTATWRDWIERGVEIDEGEAAIQDRPLHPDTLLWIDLLRLTTSIYRHGLEQPVSIYPVGDGYRLLVGERRLLSYLVLTWGGYEGFDRIPAQIRLEYNPLRQALENGARQNLNAIGIARQLSILLRALNGALLETTGQPGQSWYAEAADLTVPYGMADEVANMLGLSSPRNMNHYRNLLKLPPEVWNWADQFNWSEGKLRLMMKKASNRDMLIRLAQDEVTRLLGTDRRPKATPVERITRRAAAWHRTMTRIASLPDDDLAALPPSERDKLAQAARAILKRLGH